MIRALLLATALTTSFAAFSQPAPTRAADGRLQSVQYDAGAVVKVHGRRGYQSMIQFGSDERIENVAVGDSAAWQVTPNKRADMLFVKPILPDARTNMTVVTDKRTYMFDLVSVGAKAGPVYALRFTYPPEYRTPGSAPSALAAASATTAPELTATLPTSAPLRIHTGWAAKGDASILPARTFDDGVTTYLSWPEKALLPAILTPGPDGAESPVNFAANGDTIEIDQVHPVLILRSGDRRATLTRTAPSAASAPAPRLSSQPVQLDAKL